MTWNIISRKYNLSDPPNPRTQPPIKRPLKPKMKKGPLNLTA